MDHDLFLTLVTYSIRFVVGLHAAAMAFALLKSELFVLSLSTHPTKPNPFDNFFSWSHAALCAGGVAFMVGVLHEPVCGAAFATCCLIQGHLWYRSRLLREALIEGTTPQARELKRVLGARFEEDAK